MQTIDEETLKRNRRNAIIFGSVSIALLLGGLLIILKTVPEGEDPSSILLVSALVYIILVFLAGLGWRKWREQRTKEKMNK